MARALICHIYKISPFAVDRLIISTYRIWRQQALNLFAASSGENIQNFKLQTEDDQYFSDWSDWQRAKEMKAKWAKEKEAKTDAN